MQAAVLNQLVPKNQLEKIVGGMWVVWMQSGHVTPHIFSSYMGYIFMLELDVVQLLALLLGNKI